MIEGLRGMGHSVTVLTRPNMVSGTMGRAYMVGPHPNGQSVWGAADPRSDGSVTMAPKMLEQDIEGDVQMSRGLFSASYFCDACSSF